MKDEQVFNEVVDICREIFEEPALEMNPTTSAKDVAKWDSMTNLLLIDALEKKFQMTFSLDDIMNAANVGDLCMVIIKTR